MKDINWSKVTDNPTIKAYLELRELIEDKIFELDNNAIIKYELEVLTLPSRYDVL